MTFINKLFSKDFFGTKDGKEYQAAMSEGRIDTGFHILERCSGRSPEAVQMLLDKLSAKNGTLLVCIGKSTFAPMAIEMDLGGIFFRKWGSEDAAADVLRCFHSIKGPLKDRLMSSVFMGLGEQSTHPQLLSTLKRILESVDSTYRQLAIAEGIAERFQLVTSRSDIIIALQCCTLAQKSALSRALSSAIVGLFENASEKSLCISGEPSFAPFLFSITHFDHSLRPLAALGTSDTLHVQYDEALAALALCIHSNVQTGSTFLLGGLLTADKNIMIRRFVASILIEPDYVTLVPRESFTKLLEMPWLLEDEITANFILQALFKARKNSLCSPYVAEAICVTLRSCPENMDLRALCYALFTAYIEEEKQGVISMFAECDVLSVLSVCLAAEVAGSEQWRRCYHCITLSVSKPVLRKRAYPQIPCLVEHLCSECPQYIGSFMRLTTQSVLKTGDDKEIGPTIEQFWKCLATFAPDVACDVLGQIRTVVAEVHDGDQRLHARTQLLYCERDNGSSAHVLTSLLAKMTCPEQVEQITSTIIAITQANSKARGSFLTCVAPDLLIKSVFAGAGCVPETIHAALTLSVEANALDTQAFQNEKLLLPILKECIEAGDKAVTSLFSQLHVNLAISRRSCFLVSECGALDALINCFPFHASNESLRACLVLVMREFADSKQTKRLLSCVSKASEGSRSAMSSAVLEVVAAACRGSFKEANEPRHFLSFVPTIGSPGLIIDVDSQPFEGVSMAFAVRVEKFTRTAVLLGVSSKKLEVFTVFFERSNIGVRVAEKGGYKIYNVGTSIERERWYRFTLSIRFASLIFACSAEVFLDGTSLGKFEIPDVGDLPVRLAIGNSSAATAVETFEGLWGSIGRVSVFRGAVQTGKAGSSAGSPLAPGKNEEQPGIGQQDSSGRNTLIALIDTRKGQNGERIVLGSGVNVRTLPGSIPCRVKPALESVLALGSIHTVGLPLLALTVNPTLPFFPQQYVSSTAPPSEAPAVSVLSLLSSITSSPSACAEIENTSAVAIVSQLIKAHASTLTPTFIDELCHLARNCPQPDLLGIVAANLLLDPELLESLPQQTQLSFIAGLCDLCADERSRGLLCQVGLLRFVISATCYSFGNADNDHCGDVRQKLYQLFAIGVRDSVSCSEAEGLCSFVAHALKGPPLLSREILFAWRSVYNNSPLVEQLGKVGLGYIYVALMRAGDETVQMEAIRQFGTLFMRSRRTQELFNPKLLKKEAAAIDHRLSDVSLSLIVDQFKDRKVSKPLYRAFLDSCTQATSTATSLSAPRFGTTRRRLTLPNMLIPMAMLAEASGDCRDDFLWDVAAMMDADPLAWGGVVSLPCWYVHLLDVVVAAEEDCVADEDLLSRRVRVVFLILSKAMRACTFFEEELRMTLGYLHTQQGLHVKRIARYIVIEMLKDAARCDPSSEVFKTNVLSLMSVVDELDFLGWDPKVLDVYFRTLVVEELTNQFFFNIKTPDQSRQIRFCQVISTAATKISHADLALHCGSVITAGYIRYPVGFMRNAQPLETLASGLVTSLHDACGPDHAFPIIKDHNKLFNLKQPANSHFGASADWTRIHAKGTTFIGQPISRFERTEETSCKLHSLVVSVSLSKQTLMYAVSEELAAILKEPVRKVESVSHVIAPGAWMSFLGHVHETIWQPLTDAPYARQNPTQQHSLVRYKITPDANGTDHHDVTTAKEIRPRVDSQLAPRVKQGEIEELAMFIEVDEEMILEAEEDVSRAREFDVACEVVNYMNCWSGRMRLVEGSVELSIDTINEAFNQHVSAAAQKYLMRPNSTSWGIKQMKAIVYGRRFRMQRSAMEIQLRDNRTFLVNFSHDDGREVLARFRRANPSVVIEKGPPGRQLTRLRSTDRWKSRSASNFDYLMELNYVAGRSTQDITQYPVFPWIVADYTSEELDLLSEESFRDLSKPIGLCGSSSRAEEVAGRYYDMEEMGDVPFHYFTHYSSAAVVLYYLLRLEPYTTMQILFQGGKFDHADRLFHSIAATWRGVTKNIQDVKELVPEFYYLPEAFMNHNMVSFGTKQDGSNIAHLSLPPWAKECPFTFVYKMREALESDFVSARLHNWIDLVFGYKQRGPAAVDALNLFHPQTYEPKNKKKEALSQEIVNTLDNIGQTPIQLFTKKHPERSPEKVLLITDTTLTAMLADEPLASRRGAPVVHVHLTADRLYVTRNDGSVDVHRVNSTPYSVNKSSPIPNLFKTEQPNSFSLQAGEVALGPLSGLVTGVASNAVILPTAKDTFVVQGGMFTHAIVARSTSSSRKIKTAVAHSDIVTLVASDPNGDFIATTGMDTTIHVWRVGGEEVLSPHFSIYSHDTKVNSVTVSSALDTIASCGTDGRILLHSLAAGSYDRKIDHPLGHAFTNIVFSEDCYVPNLIAYSDADRTLRLYSLNGALIKTVVRTIPITGIFPFPGTQMLVLNTAGAVEIVHSFTLEVLSRVTVVDTVLHIAMSETNPQAIVLGCEGGTVSVIRCVSETAAKN